MILKIQIITTQNTTVGHLLVFCSSSVEQIFREANVSPGGQVQYQDFVKIACAPVPDYY